MRVKLTDTDIQPALLPACLPAQQTFSGRVLLSACFSPSLSLVGANLGEKNNFVNMEEDEWESEEEEAEEEDLNDNEEAEEDREDKEEAEQRIRSVSFPTNSQSCISTNSPFRLSNFPRVPPYYRC